MSVGCTSSAVRWQQVSELDTVQGYEAFLADSPSRGFAEEAHLRLREIKEYEALGKEASVEDCFRFISRYSNTARSRLLEQDVMKRLEQIRSAQIRSLLCNFTTTCSFDFNEYGNASIYDKRAKTERRTIVTKEYDSQILSVVTNALSPIKVKVVAPGQGPVNATLLATSKLNFISARYGPAGLLDSSAGASLVGRLTLSLTNGVSYTREIEWSTPPPNKKRYLSDGASAYVTVNKGFEVAMSNLVADVFLGRNPKPGDLK